MDFFGKQDQAKKNTERLILYFSAAVLLTIFAVYLVGVGFFLAAKHFWLELLPSIDTHGLEDLAEYTLWELLFIYSRPLYDELQWGAMGYWLWDAELMLAVGILTSLIIFLGSSFKIYQVSQGGAYVATLLGGRPLNPSTRDQDERKLLHVVEEMAIASGMSTPQIFILDHEKGINAFAAGFEPSDSVIGVTRGCLKGLSRDELQGVIAHEFSHILNGDMALNMRLVSITYGILFISIIGSFLMRLPFHFSGGYYHGGYSGGRSRSDGKGGGGGFFVAILVIMAIGFCLYVVGSIGYFTSQLLRSAVSRQREFLADASSVQFTRNRDGILGALLKIGGYKKGSKVNHPFAGEVSHFFFGNGLSGIDQWFSTHPPLHERILALDANFKGKFPEFTLDLPDIKESKPMPVHGSGTGFLSGISEMTAEDMKASLEAGRQVPHLYYAGALREAISDLIYHAAHEPFGARALVYGLLMDHDDTIRAKQMDLLERKADAAVVKELHRLWDSIWKLPSNQKIPVMDIAIPALRLLSPEQFATFRSNVRAVIDMDNQISLFEYVLEKLLTRHLDAFFGKKQPPKVKYHALLPVMDQVLILLSSLAHVGQEDAKEVERAFLEGCKQLNISNRDFALVSQEACGLDAIDTALNRLKEVTIGIRKNVVFACSTTILADENVAIREAELLRAIADVLDCPIPPFVSERCH